MDTVKYFNSIYYSNMENLKQYKNLVNSDNIKMDQEKNFNSIYYSDMNNNQNLVNSDNIKMDQVKNFNSIYYSDMNNQPKIRLSDLNNIFYNNILDNNKLHNMNVEEEIAKKKSTARRSVMDRTNNKKRSSNVLPPTTRNTTQYEEVKQSEQPNKFQDVTIKAVKSIKNRLATPKMQNVTIKPKKQQTTTNNEENNGVQWVDIDELFVNNKKPIKAKIYKPKKQQQQQQQSNIFKSGQFADRSYDDIINAGGNDLKHLAASKHVAYKQFNAYYYDILKQKKKYQNVVSEIKAKFIEKKNDFELTTILDNKFNRYYNMSTSIFAANLNNAVNQVNALEEVVTNVVNNIQSINDNINNNSLIQLIISDPQLRTPLTSHLLPMNRLPELIAELGLQLTNVLQSDANYGGNQTTVTVRTFNGTEGGAYKKLLNNDDIKLKKCIIQIKNDDNRCLIRCIVIGLAIINNDQQLKTIKDSRKLLQTTRSMELINQCDLADDGPYDNSDILKVSNIINVNIVVVDGNFLNKVVFKTKVNSDKYIYVHRHNNHFNLITSMTAFTNNAYYCNQCDTGYQNKNQHKCKEQNDKITKKNHHNCNIKFNKETKKYECNNCKKEVQKDKHHTCYIQKVELKEANDKIIYSDFEAYTNENNQQIVNLAVSAYNKYDLEYIVHHNIDDFCRWLINDIHNGYTVIFHNGAGYDFHFIHEYMVKNNLIPDVIMNGSNIKTMSLKKLNMRFIDSLQFIPEALKNFPKTFGFDNLAKGDFPHKFNRPENYDYIGTIPDIKYYDVDNMKQESRDKFIKWYIEQLNNNYEFNFKDELIKYCKLDVEILYRGCRCYRDIFMNVAGCDPFRYLTIAGVCQNIYFNQHMPKDTICVNKDYTENENNYSYKSLEWITYLEKLNDITIQSAYRGKEKVITINDFSSKVDGYDEQSNTIYQFHGCYYHGCQKCFNANDTNKDGSKLMIDMFNKTNHMTTILKNAGYNVVEIWEHDYDDMINKSKKSVDQDMMLLTNHINNIDLEYYKPIDPRDAFFGGRTNATKLYYKVDETIKEQIRYIDIMSLYPSVNYYSKYPIGEPTIIKDNFDYTLNSYFGIVKCKVIPNKSLYHPVLPHKSLDSDKLLFDLTDKIGTWSTEEVKKAIEVGYKIDKIYEVWNFENTSDELFKTYVQTFLKIKQEASGYPEWVKDEADKDAYINEFEVHHNIKLDKKKIDKNPGLKSVAKLCLNNLWGKFGQRDNMGVTEFIDKPVDLYKILYDNQVDTSSINVCEITEQLLQIHYKLNNKFVQNNNKTNIFIALHTTAMARLKLYEGLEQLKEQVIYYDTDSIIYKYAPNTNDKEIQTYQRLGYFESEFDNGEYIKEFVSGGPKNYAYTTSDENQVCKIKGVTLNHDNSKVLNFNTIKDFILCNLYVDNDSEMFGNTFLEKQLITNHIRFTKHIKTKTITTDNIIKKYNMCYDKCKIVYASNDKIDTLPFGHKDI